MKDREGKTQMASLENGTIEGTTKAMRENGASREPMSPDGGEHPDRGVPVIGGVRVDALLESLHPTARGILEAAWRVLKRDGLSGLTMKAISQEAGEHPYSITYHFGDKASLVALLMDYTVHDDNVEGLSELATLPVGPQRAHQLVQYQRDIAADPEYSRSYFDLVPYTIRNEAARTKAAELYDWYQQLTIRDLGGWEDDELRERMRPLAALMLAVLDGLALQAAYQPDFDLDGAYRLWDQMVQRQIVEILGAMCGAPAGGDRDGDDEATT